MASINVKILVGDQTKTFRFSIDSYVSDALKEIKEKLPMGTSGSADHGLFQPAAGEIKPRWLKNNRTLKFYGITNGVCYKYLSIFSLPRRDITASISN